MNFINKLERKYGRFGISNLTLYIIICYVVGYALELTKSGLLNYLTLEPLYILHGQVWRIFTWVLVPPSSLDIFTIIMLFFYYSIGNALEKTWGRFRYTLYIFSGLLFTVIGAFFLYFVTGGVYVGFGVLFSTYYISMSIFLAFAACYPDMQVLLYMIFPIKIKWLAYVDVAMLLWSAYQGIRNGEWFTLVAIVASLLNFILFFLSSRNMNHIRPKEVKRRHDYQKVVRRSQADAISKHKCAVCGRTNEDDPSLEFRFCSKCNGNYEYCQDHLFTHQHIK